MASDETTRLIALLRRDLAHLHIRMRLLAELVDMTEHELSLARRVGAGLFGEIQWALIDQILLGLARFTDVDKGGEHGTVNLGRAIELVVGKRALEVSKGRLGEAWRRIKDVRDRVLVHRDYQLHTAREEADALRVVTLGDLRSFLDDVTDLMKSVDAVYDGVDVVYCAPVMHGTFQSLFHELGDAKRFEDLRQRARRGAVPSREDLLHGYEHEGFRFDNED